MGYYTQHTVSLENATYEQEEDMKELSKEFPTVHFTVNGEGEENGDIWDHHYLGGKIQRCSAKITMPPFNPDKLTEY